MYQKTSEIVKYVLMAKTSQTSGERKLTHSGRACSGTASIQKASHGRPMWISGKRPAHMTAKSVIASAARLTDVRQRCRNRNRMAEISVPAWPMPIQKTKLVMSNAHPTVLVQAPGADAGVNSLVTQTAPNSEGEHDAETAPATSHQSPGGRVESARTTSSVTFGSVRSLATSGSRRALRPLGSCAPSSGSGPELR